MSFVNAASYFFALCGPWVHEDGSVRDADAWASRGWCRMELAAAFLARARPASLVSCGPGHEPYFLFPLDSFKNGSSLRLANSARDGDGDGAGVGNGRRSDFRSWSWMAMLTSSACSR